MFVEFYGAGLAALPLADRATIGNMSPEFGSTCAIFPIDAETLRYLSSPGARPSRSRSSRPTPRSRACGTTSTPRSRPSPTTLELDLGERRAEPRRPQAPAGPRLAERGAGRLPQALERLRARATATRPTPQDEAVAESYPASDPPANERARPRAGARRLPARSCRRRAATATLPHNGTAQARDASTARRFELDHGHVVIAAITSCTNTSNPSVMVGAGHPRAQRASRAACSASRGSRPRSRRARRSSPSTSTAPA